MSLDQILPGSGAHAAAGSLPFSGSSREEELMVPDHPVESIDVRAVGGDSPLLDNEREIGPYKLLSVLGDGGMGVVYLAEQTRPVRRRVALKVLKLGMDTEQVVARFESERQALAVMDHPNIARVLDTGVTARGRPYFAMDVVRGTTITAYADTHRLDTRERLRIFMDVCHAVQHAHHKGVIHRDLKPSNVLVAAGDDGPVVKIIDFGIAKAVGVGLTDHTLVTRVGQMIGTPEYMSPEQAEMSGLDVDTRTDIYSLGVLLYELIVGALPFDLSAKPDYVISHTLRERDVPRPSTRLTRLGDSLDEVAKHRRTTPDSLRRTLRGDLDWIILKAMDKDRTRRYATANGLAGDVGRYLANEPVVARPPSTTYRLRKFVRRNSGAVLAASVVVLALLAGGAAATLGLVEARRAQLRAEQSAATAEQGAAFLMGIFQVNEPGEAQGNTITAREVLDRGAERIRADLADQPVVQARLMKVMGDVYRQLGLFAPAQALLESAVAAAERAPDPDEAGIVSALHGLGVVHSEKGDAATAEALLLRSLDLARQRRPVDPVQIARSARTLGGVYIRLGRHSEAMPLLVEALAMQERTLGPEAPAVSVTLANIGAMYLHQRLPDRAESYLRRSLAIDEARHGPDDYRVAESLSLLGVMYFLQQRYDEAVAAHERALVIWDRDLEPDHHRIASSHHNLGDARAGQRRFEEAEAHLLQALSLKQQTYGPASTSTASTQKSLANVYRDQARYAEAEPLYRAALGILEASPQTRQIDLKEVMEAYAAMLRLAGRPDEATRMSERAAAVRSSSEQGS
jgi:eukaryotic-like serine/threonine-protein kinase